MHSEFMHFNCKAKSCMNARKKVVQVWIIISTNNDRILISALTPAAPAASDITT